MKNVTMGRLGGFTLIELLVVVLIIGCGTTVPKSRVQKPCGFVAPAYAQRAIGRASFCIGQQRRTDERFFGAGYFLTV